MLLLGSLSPVFLLGSLSPLFLLGSLSPVSAGQPVTSVSAGQPVTSVSAGQPVTSVSAGQPIAGHAKDKATHISHNCSYSQNLMLQLCYWWIRILNVLTVCKRVKHFFGVFLFCFAVHLLSTSVVKLNYGGMSSACVDSLWC